VPEKAVKGQSLADFFADNPIPDALELNDDLLGEDVFFLISSHLEKCILMEPRDTMVPVQD